MSSVEERLSAAGLTVPDVVKPVAAYLPAVRDGRYVYTSGQVPVRDGAVVTTGRVGGTVSPQEAKELAALCALNALAAIKGEIGDLDRVVRVVKVVGFVAVDPSFTEVPAVVNGASELLALAFGEQGRHARSAVGVAALPLDSPVEVEVVVSVAD